MKTSRAILLLAVLLSHLRCGAAASNAVARPADVLVVTVVNASDTTMVLPGVDVSTITGSGKVRSLGVTDEFGRVSISKAEMRESSALVILFCHDAFFCGALRVGESNLQGYDEYLFAIAPVTVR